MKGKFGCSALILRMTIDRQRHGSHKNTTIAFYVQSSLSLGLCLFLFLFICTRKTIRSIKCNQIFLNILLIHILFDATSISTETQYAEKYQCIAVNNAYFLGLGTNLVLLCVERILLIKYPTKHRNISKDFIRAIITFSWVPTLLFLCVELVNERHHVHHLLIFQVILNVVGEILLTSLVYTIHHLAKKHDRCVKEYSRLPQQSEGMVKHCSLCISAVVSFLLLWLPLLVVDLLVLYEKLDVQLTFLLQHFTPLNSLFHFILFLCLRSDMREALKDSFKETVWYQLFPRHPKIFTLCVPEVHQRIPTNSYRDKEIAMV